MTSNVRKAWWIASVLVVLTLPVGMAVSHRTPAEVRAESAQRSAEIQLQIGRKRDMEVSIDRCGHRFGSGGTNITGTEGRGTVKNPRPVPVEDATVTIQLMNEPDAAAVTSQTVPLGMIAAGESKPWNFLVADATFSNCRVSVQVKDQP